MNRHRRPPGRASRILSPDGLSPRILSFDDEFARWLGTSIFPATIMPECTRVFIGIAVPEPLERELARLARRAGPRSTRMPVDVALPFT